MKIDNRRISLVDKTVPELREMLESFKGKARGVNDELNITILYSLIQQRSLNKEA